MSGKTSVSNRKYQKLFPDFNTKLSISRQPLTKPFVKLEINNFPILSKSPTPRSQKLKKYSPKKKNFDTNVSISPSFRRIQDFSKIYKNYQKNPTKNLKIEQCLSTQKSENLRYLNLTIDDNDSDRCVNGVSTPPEENQNFGRNSPFSDIVDPGINDYMNELLNKYQKFEENRECSVKTFRKDYKLPHENHWKISQKPRSNSPFSLYSNKISDRSIKKLENNQKTKNKQFEYSKFF